MKTPKNQFWNAKFSTLVFSLAGFGFACNLAKMLLLPENTNALVFSLEALAMLFFLALLFVAINCQKQHEEWIKEGKETSAKNIKTLMDENEDLKKRIAEYELKENEEKRFASYQEKMLRKIFSDGKSATDKEHFLHLLAESFAAGAAVLYKESEPSGQFIVEEVYALPEDFIPQPFVLGEGFHGQAVQDLSPIVVSSIDADMIPVASGLGNTSTGWLYCLPVIKEGRCVYLIEMVTFKEVEIDKMWNEISTRLVDMKIF